MVSQTIADQLSSDWIKAWNRHDLDEILKHYAEDIEFFSPFVVKLLNIPDGKVRGKTALREYFATGLQKYPNLEFELIRVFSGINSIIVCYKSVENLIAAEVMIVNTHGKIYRVDAHYVSE